jgi:hypothetical protein
VLGLVAMASFFEMYDLYLFALTLKQIQGEQRVFACDVPANHSPILTRGMFGMSVIFPRWGSAHSI